MKQNKWNITEEIVTETLLLPEEVIGVVYKDKIFRSEVWSEAIYVFFGLVLPATSGRWQGL
ncbi:MAG: hypothetical protein ABIM02_05965 [candidate division WOR-3 bacterium]